MAKRVAPINYLDRDFDSIKESLVDYAKRYFPDSFKDFNEASFGALMIDAVSYIGDVLSFYVDYQANESFIDTAIEYQNVIRLAKQMGYRYQASPASSAIVTFFVKIPVGNNAEGPNAALIPILKRGTICESTGGQTFVLNEDVDFSDENNEVIVAEVDSTTGEPVNYAIKAYGQVVSGELDEEDIEIGPFQPLLSLQLSTNNITEVVSVVDSEGHVYYEVDYLSQDIIYQQIRNRRDSSTDAPLYLLKPRSVPRRFTVEHIENNTFLNFGYGSDSSLTNSPFPKVSDVVLKVHGKDYITTSNYDPSRLNEMDKLGISPSNTTLSVTVRRNQRDNANVAYGALSTVTAPVLEFEDLSTVSQVDVQTVSDSVECFNEEPAIGYVSTITSEEIKHRAIGTYAAQDRAVTANDYKAIVYRMPGKFGAIKHCRIDQDPNSSRRNLNLYCVSENSDGSLATTNSSIKENLKVWIQKYKMINDTVDILNARIVNYAIKYEAVSQDGVDKYELAESIREAVAEYLDRINLGIGESLYITDIYSTINDVPGVIDTTNVYIEPRETGAYSSASFDFKKSMSADGRIIKVPADAVMELKFFQNDIIGTIK